MPLEPQAKKNSTSTGIEPKKRFNRVRSVRDSNGNPFEKRLERIARAEGNGGKIQLKCSRKILLIRSTRLILDEVACGMKSNDLNQVGHPDIKKDMLLKLGNRIKTLRLEAGHSHYERFACEHNISRITWRRCELGGNIKFSSLLRILQALNISVTDFFSEGFD